MTKTAKNYKISSKVDNDDLHPKRRVPESNFSCPKMPGVPYETILLRRFRPYKWSF